MPALTLFKRHMGTNMHNNHSLDPLGGVEVPSLTLNTFWSWVRNAFTSSYQTEIEQYLAQATDHADLEHRMTTLSRRGLL